MKEGRVVQGERLREITIEFPLTQTYTVLRNIESQVPLNLKVLQLIAVTTTKLYHRLHIVFFYKGIDCVCLEGADLTIGATTRSPSICVSLIPIIF